MPIIYKQLYLHIKITYIYIYIIYMKTLIEVGAFDGSDSLRYHNEGYQVFTFEPKKDLYEDLVYMKI